MDELGIRLGAAALSWVAPGAGHAMRGRVPRGLVWFAVASAALVALPWSGPLGLVAMLAVRLAAAIDALVVKHGQHPRWLPVLIGTAVGSLVLVVVVRTVMLEAMKMPSAGMAPTLLVGDFFVLDKLATDPRPGDVIVFRHPDRPAYDFVERVIGRGGDRIAVVGGVLMRNGAPVPRGEPHPCRFADRSEGGAWHLVETTCAEETLGGHRYSIVVDDAPMCDFPPTDDFPRFAGAEGEGGVYTVPAGTLFVMGDNRCNSNDSRFWGPVPLGNVRGTARYVWMSSGPDGIRGGRLGTRLD